MKKPSSVNYGIQAGKVRASAIAIGDNAHATVTSAEERGAALDKLTEAVRHLQIDPTRRDMILSHVENMKSGAEPQRKSTFDKIVCAIKEVGKATEIIAPLKAVAIAFGLPILF